MDYYPLVKWSVDGRVIRTELLEQGSSNPESAAWDFRLEAGHPDFVIIGGVVRCEVSFIRSDHIPNTDLSDIDG